MDVCDIGPARYWTLEWRSFINAVLANAVDHPRRAFSSSNIVDDGHSRRKRGAVLKNNRMLNSTRH